MNNVILHSQNYSKITRGECLKSAYVCTVGQHRLKSTASGLFKVSALGKKSAKDSCIVI